jgi:polyhydroxyalkanoate synthesis regulator phasin
MPNTIESIFEKPIDRQIDGVIKADDEASLKVELQEYVLTNEIERNFAKFLNAYNNYTVANGVWISGFFGSGKSHLLKMLALVLENREVDGATALSFFEGKFKDNPMAMADLKKAVDIPSTSILFNIDQRATIISKTQDDAILAVFQKVFDEACGYYGKVPHVAAFERDLDAKGKLKDFKSAFENHAGLAWERGREQVVLEEPNIAAAYAEITGKAEADAKGILDKYRRDLAISIEDFADQVKAFIDRQEKGFRLNFFVDEVGQYIANNTKLMTNLQTVAESLNTKCKGQAWIIVTAQQEMSDIIGDMTRQQEHDFSKIQARFAHRMPLNSKDVAEVIQKRLLAKTEDGHSALVELYGREKNNMRTLFEFTDGSRTFRTFDDGEHFATSYPFARYQYDLFQSAIQELSKHNAFEGKHSSVGERSMLGVFQEVAKSIKDLEIGTLASFDRMFEGIRSALKSSVQQSINQAENNLPDEFAVQVLKALFLVKYVREFKPSIHNITILMLDTLDGDQKALRRKVEEALARLEQESYVQRNGDLYEFLTDEEKDIENEIKSTHVDPVEVGAELNTLIFDQIVKARKISHGNINHDYAYTRRIDDQSHGREYELAINVITPFHDNSGDTSFFKSTSLDREELIIVLDEDNRLLSDLKVLLQTEKYVKQAHASSMRDDLQVIVRERAEQNNRRRKEVLTRLGSLLSKADFVVRGQQIDIGGEDPAGRIMKGFQNLLDQVYPNLSMLRGVSYAESDLTKNMDQAKDGLFGDGGAADLTEAEQAVFDAIVRDKTKGLRATIKSVAERFEKKPYGWPLAAIQNQLAILFGRNKIDAKSDSNALDGLRFVQALKNTHGHGQIILEPQVEFSAAQVRQLTQFHNEFFNDVTSIKDAKMLALATQQKLDDERQELEILHGKAVQFPFLDQLGPVVAQLKEISGKSYQWLLEDLSKVSDDLLDAKENTISPIRTFMGGAQKDIYEDARHFIRTAEANFQGELKAEADAIREMLADNAVFRGGTIQSLKAKLETLKEKVHARVDDVRKAALKSIGDRKKAFEADADFGKLSAEHQANFSNAFDAALSSIKAQTLIAVVRDIQRQFEDSEYPGLLARMQLLAKRGSETGGSDGTPDGGVTEPSIVPIRNVYVSAPKAVLQDEGDLDEYLSVFREAVLEEIKSGKKVSV